MTRGPHSFPSIAPRGLAARIRAAGPRASLAATLALCLSASAPVTAALSMIACGGGGGGGGTNQNNNTQGATCGDGVVDPGEQCDDGAANSDVEPNACRSDCRRAHCGDGVKDQDEVCDLLDLGGQACPDVGAFDGGQLACSTDCTFDTGACTRCGDGVMGGDEECDAQDFGGASCASLGYGQQGALTCAADCTVAGDQCYTCGDGVLSAYEECEPGDLQGASCGSLGFAFGVLGCDPVLCQYDTTACHSMCGNGVRDGDEQCDGPDVGGVTCASAGFSAGEVACTASCQLSFAACTHCGDGTRDSDEECDGGDLGGESCASLGGSQASGTLGCTAACRFDTSGCTTSLSSCGNGLQEGTEQCDGWDLNGESCATLHPSLYDGGSLGCTAACLFDTTYCTRIVASACGDGVADASQGEACDGQDLLGLTCADLGFRGGTLGCTAECALDTSLCLAPTTCGNGAVDPDQGEACDGALLGDHPTCASLGFVGGTVSCTAQCLYDVSGCTTCGNGVRDGADACDASDLGGATCRSLGYGAGDLACRSDCTYDTSGCRACSPEQCNGLDDDCDGTADEDFGCPLGAVETGCIVPGCGPGQRTCEAGCVWGACTIPEVCNGVDDDCDGTTDEGFDCALGATRACTNSCGDGQEECVAGCVWSGQCVIPEVCNGLDDDCDSGVDEDFDCALGATQGCTTSCGTFGMQYCNSSCAWGTCLPPAEQCNGVDDNCNGDVDESGYAQKSGFPVEVSTTSYNWGGGQGPGAAWNGTELGVVWADSRDSNFVEIYFARYDELGQPVGPQVALTDHNTFPDGAGGGTVSLDFAIAPSGTGWGVSFSVFNNGSYSLYFMRLAADGTVLQAPVWQADSAMHPELVWTGLYYGLAYAERNVGARLKVIDGAGSLVTGPVTVAVVNEAPWDLLWNGTNFALTIPEGGYMYFYLLDVSGTTQNSLSWRIVNGFTPSEGSTILWNGTDFLWAASGRFYRIDAQGNEIEHWEQPTSNPNGGVALGPGTDEVAVFSVSCPYNLNTTQTWLTRWAVDTPTNPRLVQGSIHLGPESGNCGQVGIYPGNLVYTGTTYLAVWNQDWGVWLSVIGCP